MISNKRLLILLAVAMVVTIVYRFEEYKIAEDFTLFAHTLCNPFVDSCFVEECNDASDAECDTTPYKKIEIHSRVAPACLLEHTCEAFSCDQYSACQETYCSSASLESGERCLSMRSR